jgi:hypothetical protein
VACEQADFRRRPQVLVADDALAVNVRPAQTCDERAPRLVVADRADDCGVRAERGEVGGAVGRAARHGLRALVPQNQHRSLARHATDLAVHELIRDQVADDHDAPFGKLRDKFGQTSLRRRMSHKIFGEGVKVKGERLEKDSYPLPLTPSPAFKISRTASSKSSATRSGWCGQRVRWYSHSPRP